MDENKTLRSLKILSLLTILFIVYNTLIPFKPYLEWWKIVRNLNRVQLVPFVAGGRLNSLTDLVGNVILFLPFGFFVALYFIHLKQTLRVYRVVLLGFLLSLSVEILQIGFRYRTPSVTDLITNTFGTFLGVVTAQLYFKQFEQKFKQLLHHILKNEPVTLVLLLIILVQFFASVLPFNVTITISDLKKAVAYTNIQPFGFKPLGQMFNAHLKHLDRFAFSKIDFFGNVLFYAIFGYLVLYSYFQYWRKRHYGKLIVIALLIVYFPVLEMTQFFIKSRFSDVNDIISGYFGAWSGAIVFLLVKRNEWFRNGSKIVLRHFTVPILIYLIYIFYKGLSPFNFSLHHDVWSLNLKIRYLVPFYAYYKVTSLWNIYDLVESFFWLMPLGFIIAYWLKEQSRLNRAYQMAFVFGLLVSSIIEVSQVFLPTRTGDITDIIFTTTGCLLGVYLFKYYNENYLQRTKPSEFVNSLSK